MERLNPYDVNTNYYTSSDTNDTNLLIFAVIIILIVVLLFMYSSNTSPEPKTYEKFDPTIKKTNSRVWSGLGNDTNSIITPIKKKPVLEKDAPLSNTVTSRYVQTDFGKSY